MYVFDNIITVFECDFLGGTSTAAVPEQYSCTASLMRKECALNFDFLLEHERKRRH